MRMAESRQPPEAGQKRFQRKPQARGWFSIFGIGPLAVLAGAKQNALDYAKNISCAEQLPGGSVRQAACAALTP